jgi:uncharacterized circularly permuted ATP-grasp superfamily protein
MNALNTRAGLLRGYDAGKYYCELLGSSSSPHPVIEVIERQLSTISEKELRNRATVAENDLFDLGVTFTVYSEKTAIDRVLPFDLIPRVLTAAEWRQIEAGVIQRVTAINLFLADIYGDQRVLADGIVPRALVFGNPNFRREMQGVKVRKGVYVAICGIDIVRDETGRFLVLEDNARTPSGVSYVIENRRMMLRAWPELFEGLPVQPVDPYGPQLRKALAALSPDSAADPHIVLLTPGTYNSAYFEHVFLAREMGIPLVEGRDLTVIDSKVYMRTIAGLRRVDTVYRRIDDDFLDPRVFRPDSILGVPGLMEAYVAGNVQLANAVGTGVADDKAVYAYMPRLIRYYLDQEPILSNVDTHLCAEPEGLAFTLANLETLVVKPVGASGGYGVMIGPRSSQAEIEETRAKILDDPGNFISQPVVGLSVCPTLCAEGIAPRHVDLRPFAVTGDRTWVLPGGLTRVALRKNSLVVNSSQGGGSKDTWVLMPEASWPANPRGGNF